MTRSVEMIRLPEQFRAFLKITAISALGLLLVLTMKGPPFSAQLLGLCLLGGTINAMVVTISVRATFWICSRYHARQRRRNSQSGESLK